MSDERRVLVTGGSGFLGGWCIIELLRGGYDVRTTVRDLAREAEVRATVAQEVDAGERLAVVAADLTRDEGWDAAVAGCDHVLHVASPFPRAQPDDPDELIVPAREGTLRVLDASLAAGARRVVITSSVAAVRNFAGRPSGRALTEEDWTDPDLPGLSPYTRSKTIAERAAWEHAEARGARERVATVNPSAIVGPVLNDDPSFSLDAIGRMLGGMPGVPRLSFSFVDVRDVAALHVLAMTAPEAAGERFLAAGPSLWLADVAALLRRELGADAAKVPRRTLPDLLVRAAARFDSGLRTVVGDLGEMTTYSDAKARTRLGWAPRPIEETLVETARSLLARRAALCLHGRRLFLGDALSERSEFSSR